MDTVSTVSDLGKIGYSTRKLTQDLGGPYLLKFGVESKWSCDATSTARFKHNLAQSLRDMRRIVEAQQGAGGEAVKAKL